MGIFQKLTHNNLVQIISIKNPHKLKDVSSLNSAQIKMSVWHMHIWKLVNNLRLLTDHN